MKNHTSQTTKKSWHSRVKASVGAALIAFGTFGFAGVAQAGPGKDRVDAVYGQVKNIANTAKTKDEVVSKLASEFDAFIDYDLFSERTLRNSWPTLNEAQKKRFIESFKQLILHTYAKKFEPGSEFRVEHRSEKTAADNKNVTVKTTVHSSKVSADVDYILSLGDKGPKVYDIVIDDVSMSLNWRRQFDKIIEKEGFETLIQRINKNIEK